MPLRPPRRLIAYLTALVGACALLGAIAGCGSSSPAGPGTTAGAGALDGLSAQQVFARMQAAGRQATSVRVAGATTEDGERLNIELRLVRGVGGQGTIRSGGVTAQIFGDGERLLLKGNEAFYRATVGPDFDPEQGKLVVDRWVKLPGDDPNTAELASMVDPDRFFTEFLKGDGTLSRVAGKTIGGVPTVGLKDDDPDKGEILYVADDGSDLPVAVEALTGPPGDQIRFTEWGVSFTITEPPADEVVDLTSTGAAGE